MLETTYFIFSLRLDKVETELMGVVSDLGNSSTKVKLDKAHKLFGFQQLILNPDIFDHTPGDLSVIKLKAASSNMSSERNKAGLRCTL